MKVCAYSGEAKPESGRNPLADQESNREPQHDPNHPAGDENEAQHASERPPLLSGGFLRLRSYSFWRSHIIVLLEGVRLSDGRPRPSHCHPNVEEGQTNSRDLMSLLQQIVIQRSRLTREKPCTPTRPCVSDFVCYCDGWDRSTMRAIVAGETRLPLVSVAVGAPSSRATPTNQADSRQRP